jgi:hypothetical protein
MSAKSKIPKAPPTTMPAMAPLDIPIQIGIITMSASYMAIYNHFHTMIISHITLSLFNICINIYEAAMLCTMFNSPDLQKGGKNKH